MKSLIASPSEINSNDQDELFSTLSNKTESSECIDPRRSQMDADPIRGVSKPYRSIWSMPSGVGRALSDEWSGAKVERKEEQHGRTSRREITGWRR